jgi:hypothetical protein
LVKSGVGRGLSFYDRARGRVRNLAGLDNRIDQSLPAIPFTNVAEASGLALLGEDKVYLGGDAINLIRSDPDMIEFEQALIKRIKLNSRYGQESFSVENYGSGVEFGGDRTPDEIATMGYQAYDQFIRYPASSIYHSIRTFDLRNPWTNRYQDTWNVAGNELTWLIRHGDVVANAYVHKNGTFTINYQLTDTLDLRPDWKNRSDAYNYATTVLGFFYHDVARGTELKIEGNWTSTYPP